jgi:hypothetical protein
VASLVEARIASPEVAGSISDGVIEPQYGTGVDSDSNKNDYQKHLLGGKGGRCVGWQTKHFHMFID